MNAIVGAGLSVFPQKNGLGPLGVKKADPKGLKACPYTLMNIYLFSFVMCFNSFRVLRTKSDQ